MKGSDEDEGPREVVRGSGRRRDPKDRRKDRRGRADPDLDPMDPASYGDCGRCVAGVSEITHLCWTITVRNTFLGCFDIIDRVT